MNKPYVIDMFHGDEVQDYPGQPLGGFAKVKALGIFGCIHKATEGAGVIDSRYKSRRKAWMDGGKVTVDGLETPPKWAAYHFLHGDNPVGEADFFLSVAELGPEDEAVCDWEHTPIGSATRDQAQRFCARVEERLGRSIIVYGGDVLKSRLKGKDLDFSKRRLWLAQYSRSWHTTQDDGRQTWNHPWLWQNNGDNYGPGPHKLPGIDGYIDNSTLPDGADLSAFIASWGTATAVPSPHPAPAPAPFVVTTPQVPEKETPMAPTPAPVAAHPHIDLQQVKAIVQGINSFFPLLSTFVPQARPFQAYLPALGSVIKIIEQVEAANGDVNKIIYAVADGLHEIGDVLKGAAK
jgi:GH25 family lysozyme M1 (1,4-beta-N-acetylmuramidase)